MVVHMPPRRLVRFVPIVLLLGVRPEAPAAAADPVAIETQWVRVELSPEGRVTGLRDKTTGRDRLAPGPPSPLMRVRIDGRSYDVTSLVRRGDRLLAGFGQSGLTAELAVDERDTFFTIAVASVSRRDVDYLEFVRLPVAAGGATWARRINAVYDDQFAAAVLAASPETNAVPAARTSRSAILAARCWPAVAVEGVRAAVVGCPADKLLDTIEQVELGCGLPHPTIDGVWWKRSPEVRKGYLFCNPTGADVDKAIRYAKQAGLPYIMFLSGTWTTSYGHYPIHRGNFPRGEADLKGTVDKIHAEGMKAGLHFLSACISKRDAYVTPKPDPRLAKDGQLTLAADVDAAADFLPTREPPEGFVTEAHYGTAGGVDLQIGDELITYSGLRTTPPYGFTGCRRGAYGTQAASHAGGAAVYHLTQRYNMLLPDPNSDLVDEIADRIAHIYNECGFDMVYFDGGEAMAATGPSWYTVSLIHRAFARRVKRPVLWQGSGSTHYSWHLFSRGNCDDYACLDPKAYCDRHKTPRIEQSYRPDFVAAELGWWGYLLHTPAYPATTPDEIEYMCAKAVGWDAAVNLECSMEHLDQNGRTAEALERMRIWQQLQHADYFPESVKAELRRPEMDFTLVRDGQGRWRARPVKHHPERIADPGRPETLRWTLDNRLGAGPVSLRVRALPAAAPPGDPDNRVLLRGAALQEVNTFDAAGGVDFRFHVSPAGGPAGGPCLELSARRGAPAAGAWAFAGRRLAKPIDLTRHRPLALWVRGDGNGQLLNVQLEDAGHRRRDHYIDVDFTGWRRIILDQPATRRVWDYPWPYNRKWAIRHFSYNAVRAVNVYLANLPQDKTAAVGVAQIEALAERPAALESVTVRLGGQSLRLPVRLADEAYAEADQGVCRRYDPNGRLLETAPCPSPLTAQQGVNRVSVELEGSARAAVTIMVNGPM